MKDLIVVGFHGKHRAAEILDELESMSEDWTIDLQDGVAAYRRDNGRLRIESSVNPTELEGAGLGGALGLMVGAVLAAPFTAGASAAAAATAIGATAVSGGAMGAAMGGADAFDWKGRFGISDDFVEEVGGMIQPGDSAVFALLSTTDPQEVADHFRRYGGTVLRTTLDPAVADTVQRTIRA